MTDIIFNAQSISNRDISFENGPGDQIKYSYCGRYTQLGKDFGIITMPQLLRISGKWDVPEALNVAYALTESGDCMNEKCMRPKLALYLKNLYVSRNVKVLQRIINEKNKAIEARINNELNSSILINLLHVILKIVTVFQFSLKDKLKTTRLQKQKFTQIRHYYSTSSFIDTVKRVEEFWGIRKGWDWTQPFTLIKKKRSDKPLSLDESYPLFESFLESPNQKIEDFIEFAGPLAQRFTLDQLYHTDLYEIFGHCLS